MLILVGDKGLHFTAGRWLQALNKSSEKLLNWKLFSAYAAHTCRSVLCSLRFGFAQNLFGGQKTQLANQKLVKQLLFGFMRWKEKKSAACKCMCRH